MRNLYGEDQHDLWEARFVVKLTRVSFDLALPLRTIPTPEKSSGPICG